LRGGIFLGKWRSTFAGNSNGKMNAKSAYALNTRYMSLLALNISTLFSKQSVFVFLLGTYVNVTYHVQLFLQLDVFLLKMQFLNVQIFLIATYV
jgi:hypothetical protein